MSRVREECSEIVASLIESCLQDDPKQRPTASEIVCILEQEFCCDRAQSAPAPSVEPLAVATPRAVKSLHAGAGVQNAKASGPRKTTLKNVDAMV
jgi:hypothetical protein